MNDVLRQKEVVCDECGYQHDEENEEMSIVLCGDCLYPISKCGGCTS